MTTAAMTTAATLAPTAATSIVAFTATTAGSAPAYLGTRLGFEVLHHLQRHLAHPIDGVDHHAKGVPFRQVVADTAYMAGAVQLGDMQETVTAREDVDEGAEVGDAHHLPFVLLVHLGRRWEGDLLDSAQRVFERRPIAGGHQNRTVVLHFQSRACHLLQLADDLALRTDDLTDLVDRYLHGFHPGRVFLELLAWLGNSGPHHVEDLETRLLRLGESPGQNLGRKTVDLHIELESGDHVGGAGHLEVHISQSVLRPQDVRQGHVTVALGDQAHGDSRHGSGDSNSRIHERERGSADRSHGRGAVRGENLRHETKGVLEFVPMGNDRLDRLLRQRSMSDLPPLRTPHEAGFAGRVGREVVMMHVPLALLVADRVEELLHAGHAEREHVQHLGLAPGEESGSVGAAENVDLGGERSYLGAGAAIHADAVTEDAVAHRLLDNCLERPDALRREFRLLPLFEQVDHLLLENRLGGVALGLVGNLDHPGYPVGHQLAHPFVNLIGVVEEHRPVPDLLACHRPQFRLQVCESADVLLRHLKTLRHFLLVRWGLAIRDQVHGEIGCPSLHHHDVHVARPTAPTGDNQVEHALLQFGEGGEGNPVPVLQRQANRADRPFEREIAQGQGRRSAVEGEDVVCVFAVDLQNSHNHMGVVSISVPERGTQRTIDEACTERGALCGPPFPPEEGAGDLAHGVHPLLDIDGQREEVHGLPGSRVGCGGDQGLCPGHRNPHRPVCLAGQLSGGNDDLAITDLAANCVFRHALSFSELLAAWKLQEASAINYQWSYLRSPCEEDGLRRDGN